MGIESAEVVSQKCTTSRSRLGFDPGSDNWTDCVTAKCASCRATRRPLATLLFALREALQTAGRTPVHVASPLYRSLGRPFLRADDQERDGILARIDAEGIRGKVNIQRFKGLGEMNPLQLRETTMDPNTRRLVQLNIDAGEETFATIDMLLAKNRAGDRKIWLTEEGNKADLLG